MLFRKLADEVIAKVSALAGGAIGGLIGGQIGAALGALAGWLTGWLMGKLTDAIIDIFDDDPFNPVTLELHHSRLHVTDEHGQARSSTSPVPGEYAVRYRWRVLEPRPQPVAR